MLVLSRKVDERIVIGDEFATITVVEIRGDKVRLGVDAAKDVPIHRREVYNAIQRIRRQAAEAMAARLNAAGVFGRCDWSADELLATSDPAVRSAVQSEFEFLWTKKKGAA